MIFQLIAAASLILTGAILLLTYGVYRAIRSEGWDDSNALNFIRLISHVFIHPEDFGRMYYLNVEQYKLLKNNNHQVRRPFEYISKDEFSENFPDSRP